MDGKKYRVDSLSTTYSALPGTSTVEQIINGRASTSTQCTERTNKIRANKQKIIV
jgi:hypothetical protein